MLILTPQPLRLFPVGAKLALSVSAGWNQTTADWARTDSLLGFGLAVDGILASSITAWRDPAGWAWIGMVLTLPAYRGRGLARQLLSHTLELLAQEGITSIGLDATTLGEPLYRQFDFLPTQILERWTRPGEPLSDPPSHQLSFSDPLLASLAPSSHIWRHDDDLLLLRPGRLFNHLGPFFASSPALLSLIPSSLSLCWDLFPDHPQAHAAASTLGLVPTRRLQRMWRGPALSINSPRQWALSGFEYGR
ncbi:MAG: GNAT family N-acetyltransferase [Bryobacter sp.]|nr:GNAT family N-acetyltransferase [Bryobacter sp. CoA8 C33]